MRSLRLIWAGGEHEFALPIGALRGLQGARDAGPEQILNRLRLGEWQIDDAVQVIRWGLHGAGMEAGEAARLVTPLVDLHPLAQFKLTALAVLSHALFGPEDDPAGEAQGVVAAAPENGASHGSTAMAR
ncbi:gene transfer agent family protein [Salipiger abyssi]|uniref:gene transfer agent family protein n=1 Tax=Salipiger abyssi TaxID=1250539 RepID=UPI004057E8FD